MLEGRFLENEAATEAAARELAPYLHTGDMVFLDGLLGAGKTTFARALIRALPLADGSQRPDEPVPSPTYTLVQTYERSIGLVGHFDLYRTTDPEEIWDLGMEDILESGLALIEWGERLGPLRPKNALTITLSDQGQGRLLEVVDGRTLT